jgi:hypothetical protein
MISPVLKPLLDELLEGVWPPVSEGVGTEMAVVML